MIDDTAQKEPRFSDEYDYEYLKFDWFSHDPRLKAIANALGNLCKDDITPLRRSKKDLDTAFNVVLTALEVSGAYEGKQIRIPMYSAIYGGKYQRSKAHTREILTALTWLKDCEYLGLIDGKRKAQNNKNKNVQDIPSAYILSEKWLSKIALEPISAVNLINRNPLSPYIQVRDRIKNSIDRKYVKVTITPTDEQRSTNKDLIKQTEDVLTAYEKLMASTIIKLGDELISSKRASYTRIFNNGGFEDGGRFYSDLQGLKREQRLNIIFNGDPVIEIDYTGMHPTMLYEIEGITPHPAPYDIAGFNRDDVKIAFNILVNRDSKRHQNSEASSIQNNTHLSTKEAQRLRDSLYMLHGQIAHRFNEGYGLKLQKIDSDIALNILEYFVTKIKKPIIMIHDSAIVSVRDSETLMLVMRDEYLTKMENLFKAKKRIFNIAVSLTKDSDNDSGSAHIAGNGVKISSKNLSTDIEDLIVRAISGEAIDNNIWDYFINAGITKN